MKEHIFKREKYLNKLVSKNRQSFNKDNNRY